MSEEQPAQEAPAEQPAEESPAPADPESPEPAAAEQPPAAMEESPEAQQEQLPQDMDGQQPQPVMNEQPMQQMDPNQMMQQQMPMMDPAQQQQMDQQFAMQQQFEQQQQQQQPGMYVGDNKAGHYFDSIETDVFRMPDKFQVEVRMQDNQIKRVNVEVERAKRPKPNFGGFRNNKTGYIYKHAFTQTDQRLKDHCEKNERMVQTYEYKTKSTIMMREMGVQMDVGLGSKCEVTGLYGDTRKDKIIRPNKHYFSSRMWAKEREDTTLYIQCRVRAWFARKRTYNLRKQRDDKDAEMKSRQEQLRAEEENKRKVEVERRLHPKKGKDFDILYNELEAWRLNETKKIKNSSELNEEEKKLALQQLLNKETKILQKIDRLKITAHDKNKQEKINNFLRAMSDPKLWKRSDGRFTEVHTPFSTRAKELMDLYNGLRLPFLSTDERLDVLLHTKWTVKEFDCNLTREIVDLIDREADMLNRGRTETSLEGLRKRLSNLFLQFIETPEFNPEAARFQKVPRELLQQTQSIIFE